MAKILLKSFGLLLLLILIRIVVCFVVFKNIFDLADMNLFPAALLTVRHPKIHIEQIAWNFSKLPVFHFVVQ